MRVNGDDINDSAPLNAPRVRGRPRQDRQACARPTASAVRISETCDRYQGKRVDENGEVADWLVRLNTANRTWGVGLCFLNLRNIKHCP